MSHVRDHSIHLAALPRQWPWRGSLIVGAVVVLVTGAARHWNFNGIEGFSTTNYGWLGFSLVGGIGLARRLSRSPGGWWTALRPLSAALMAFAVCFIAVTVTGLVFIPGQPLAETLTTDAPGRAVWVAIVVAAAGYASEVLQTLARLARR